MAQGVSRGIDSAHPSGGALKQTAPKGRKMVARGVSRGQTAAK